MDKIALKKAILPGILSGLLTWVFYSLLSMWLQKQTFFGAMFSTFGIIFAVVITLVEIWSYYRTMRRTPEPKNDDTVSDDQ